MMPMYLHDGEHPEEEVCEGCGEPIYEDGIGNWCHASDGARFCSRPTVENEDPDDAARPAATWHVEADNPPTYAGAYHSPREAAEQASRYTFPVRVVRDPASPSNPEARVVLGNVGAMSDNELTEAIETEPTPDEHDPEGFTALLRAEAERRGIA